MEFISWKSEPSKSIKEEKSEPELPSYLHKTLLNKIRIAWDCLPVARFIMVSVSIVPLKKRRQFNFTIAASCCTLRATKEFNKHLLLFGPPFFVLTRFQIEKEKVKKSQILWNPISWKINWRFLLSWTEKFLENNSTKREIKQNLVKLSNGAEFFGLFYNFSLRWQHCYLL